MSPLYHYSSTRVTPVPDLHPLRSDLSPTRPKTGGCSSADSAIRGPAGGAAGRLSSTRFTSLIKEGSALVAIISPPWLLQNSMPPINNMA